MAREFFASRFANPEDRLDLLEEWAAEFSGRQPVDLIAGQQALADQSLVSTGGSSGSGGSSGTLNGDVIGFLTANTVKKLNGIALSGTPATGDVYSYNGTSWASQQFVTGKWGVGPATPGTYRFEIDDDPETAWFDGTHSSLKTTSRGWHISKTKTSAHSSTFAWHSDGAPCWEIGLDSATNNSLNSGFGNADWKLVDYSAGKIDAGTGAGDGAAVFRISPAEATADSYPRFEFGSKVTTPVARSAMVTVRSPKDLVGLWVQTGVGQTADLFHVEGEHSRLTYHDLPLGAAGQRGLTIEKLLSSDASAHGIDWMVQGTRKWNIGMDTSTSDMIVFFDWTANAGVGADVLRGSQEADSTLSATPKFNWGRSIGSPAANGTFLNIAGGDNTTPLGGLAVSYFGDGTVNGLTFTERSGSHKATRFNWNNLWIQGTDITAANNSHLWLAYDSVNSKNRVFVKASSASVAAVGIGSINPQAALSVLTSSAAGDYNTVQRGFHMQYADSPGNRAVNIEQILSASEVWNYAWLNGGLGSGSTAATRKATSSFASSWGLESGDTSFALVTAPAGTDQTIASLLKFDLSGGSNRLGVFGTTPQAQQGSTADLKDTFCGYGFQVNGGATPLNLDGGALFCGAFQAGGVVLTTTASLGSGDRTAFGDATTAPFTITLPSAVGRMGREYSAIKTDASANAVTLAAAGAETINGAGTVVLAAQNNRVTVRSNNVNWFIFAA